MANTYTVESGREIVLSFDAVGMTVSNVYVRGVNAGGETVLTEHACVAPTSPATIWSYLWDTSNGALPNVIPAYYRLVWRADHITDDDPPVTFDVPVPANYSGQFVRVLDQAQVQIVPAEFFKTSFLRSIMMRFQLPDPFCNSISEIDNNELEQWLRACTTRVEQDLGCPLMPVTVTHERHDWERPPAYSKKTLPPIMLRKRPIREVTGIRFRYGNSSDSSVGVIPTDWAIFDKTGSEQGSASPMINIVPKIGSQVATQVYMLMFGNVMMPFYGSGAGMASLPLFLEVDYKWGFRFTDFTFAEQEDIMTAICERAMVDFLLPQYPYRVTNSKSIGVDGLSQSFSYNPAGYESLANGCEQLYMKWLWPFKSKYGLSLTYTIA